MSLSRQSADYKMIKVDGVEVSDKTIRSGKYALCRDYYVAYKGKLNSVEQDFLRYIMSAGQKEVDKICVGKKKAATFLVGQIRRNDLNRGVFIGCSDHGEADRWICVV